MNDNIICEITIDMVAVEKNGKFWGLKYDDGPHSVDGWVDDIEKAYMKPHCDSPEKISWKSQNNPWCAKEVQTGRLVKVEIHKVFRYID